MSEKLYNNNNNVSLNEREAEKRETEIKTIVNAGLSKCALSEPIMGPAAGDSIKKAKWKIFQSKKSCHSIGQLPDLVIEGDCTLKRDSCGIIYNIFIIGSIRSSSIRPTMEMSTDYHNRLCYYSHHHNHYSHHHNHHNYNQPTKEKSTDSRGRWCYSRAGFPQSFFLARSG